MFIEIRNAPVGDENVYELFAKALLKAIEIRNAPVGDENDISFIIPDSNIIEIRNAPVGDENGLDLFIMRTPLN